MRYGILSGNTFVAGPVAVFNSPGATVIVNSIVGNTFIAGPYVVPGMAYGRFLELDDRNFNY